MGRMLKGVGAVALMAQRPIILSSFPAVAGVDLGGLSDPSLRSLTASSTQAIFVKINYASGTLLNFDYSTPNGNQPNSYENNVYLWPVSSDSVPWNSPAQFGEAILLNQPTGDQNLSNVNITNGAYIIGYANGPLAPGTNWSEYLNVVATAYLAPNQTESHDVDHKICSIAPQFVGDTSLVYEFNFLDGFNAAKSQSWVGLWEGEGPSYGTPPKWAAAIEIASDSGTSGMDGITLARATTYSLGLYDSGYTVDASQLDIKRLVCTATFTT